MRKCMVCGTDTKVVDTRFKAQDNTVVRVRECLRPKCDTRFVTKEVLVKQYHKNPWGGHRHGNYKG